ncbi:MAG: AAA family ATPase [Coleofasciculus sp. S288]|nr:AAA family ATPase [Coleofasciculus sp. S288]
MNYFGLKRTFDHVGYFETEQQAQLFKELKPVIRQGGLVALSGIVGCGKTTTLQRLQSELAQEKDIIISRSLAVDKDRVSLGTLMTALFYDLTTEKDLKLPKEPEQRERRLLGLIQKCRKPVALFVDEAHDLHNKTLVGLKRLIELCGSKALFVGHLQIMWVYLQIMWVEIPPYLQIMWVEKRLVCGSECSCLQVATSRDTQPEPLFATVR